MTLQEAIDKNGLINRIGGFDLNDDIVITTDSCEYRLSEIIPIKQDGKYIFRTKTAEFTVSYRQRRRTGVDHAPRSDFVPGTTGWSSVGRLDPRHRFCRAGLQSFLNSSNHMAQPFCFAPLFGRQPIFSHKQAIEVRVVAKAAGCCDIFECFRGHFHEQLRLLQADALGIGDGCRAERRFEQVDNVVFREMKFPTQHFEGDLFFAVLCDKIRHAGSLGVLRLLLV